MDPSTAFKNKAAESTRLRRRRRAISPLDPLPEHLPHRRVSLPSTSKTSHRSNTSSSFSQEAKRTKLHTLTDEDLRIFAQFSDLPAPESSDELNESDLIMLHTCPICTLTVDYNRESHRLRCGHEFCKICLIDEIENNFHPQVSCLNGDCNWIMNDEELSIILGKEKFTQFDQRRARALAETAESLRQDELLVAELIHDEQNFLANVDEFECEICFTDASPGDGIVLKNCLHKFCKNCLINHIRSSEDVLVRCPAVNCTEVISDREMRGFMPLNELELHLRMSLKAFEGSCQQTFHCKKPDCHGFVEIADKDLIDFRCEICDETNCIACNVIHTNQTCKEYKDAIDADDRKKREEQESKEAIEAMVKRNEAMFCPSCRIPVEKTEGCDFIECSTCKLGICWATKKPRMPFTQSDGTVVDGCHCGENGKRCHPLCGYCH